MSNKEKHKEILEAAGLPTVKHGKRVDEFSSDEIDEYVIAWGHEAFIERSKLDRKFKQLAELDQEIEQKQQETGTGKVSRSEFEKVQKQVSERKVPYERLDDLLVRAKEFGMSED